MDKNEFNEDLEIFNRRVQNDERLQNFIVSSMHVINDSGAFALQVNDTTIQETRRVRAEDFDHVLDMLCAINAADLSYMDAMREDDDEEYPDHEPYLPDFGPPGSGAVITEYAVGTFEEPW